MRRKRSGTPQSLFTIGYEGRSMDELLARLKSASVATLIDVRYRPQSRKRGFSKTKLSEACANDGIRYIHSRQLGTPPDMMRRVGVGGYDNAAFDEYRRYVRVQIEALTQAERLLQQGTCCLLCYEADGMTCHRRVVAEELSRLTGAHVTHL